MSDSVRYADRMSPSDALLWSNELDPMLRSTIVSVMLLEGAPDPGRFERVLARSIERIPRLRQRVVLDPIAAAPPRWERDPLFDPRYHVRRVSVPGAGTLRDLLDLAQPIAMQAFDKDRPLWELYQVSGLEHGRTALLIKLHHAVSDGVGLVRMTSSLVERSPEPRPERPGTAESGSILDEPSRGAFGETLAALRYRAGENLERTTRVAGALGAGALRALRDPLGAARDAGHAARSVARMLRPVSEPLSQVMRERSLGVRFDAFGLPLDDLKRAAKAVGGTLNDAFVGAVTGGLRVYHEHHGRPAAELRMTMPINVREGEAGKRAGNQFAPARFAVPISIPHPAARMLRLRDLVARERREPALGLLDDVAALLSRLPSSISVSLFGSMLKSIDFVTSNVPGPPFPVWSSGARVESMFGFGPLSGAAVNVTLFSYDGQVQFAIATDPAAVRDPEFFTDCLKLGVEEILSVA
jgi:WS/DGAT/MGAT family acyltransferase